MKFFTPLLFALVLSVTTPALADYPTFKHLYGGLLADYVVPGEKQGIQSHLVDYKAWRADPRHARALEFLEKSNVPEDSYTAALAYWINAYNFLAIDIIVQSDAGLDSIIDAAKVFESPWRHFSWTVSGRPVSLDYIEDKILRVTNEGYITTAITKAALSSPDLRRQPYHSEDLKQQLFEQARGFLTNPAKGLRVQDGGVLLSKAFERNIDLFGGQDGLMKFIRAHLPDQEIPNAFRGYMTYNWDLNAAD